MMSKLVYERPFRDSPDLEVRKLEEMSRTSNVELFDTASDSKATPSSLKEFKEKLNSSNLTLGC